MKRLAYLLLALIAISSPAWGSAPYVVDSTVDLGAKNMAVAYLSGATSGGNGNGGGPDCSTSGVTEIDECTVWLVQATGITGNTVYQDQGGGPNSPHTILGFESDERVTHAKFGPTSILCHGSHAPNDIQSAAHSDFDFGSGDFTLDLWVYNTSNGWYCLLGNTAGRTPDPGAGPYTGGWWFGTRSNIPHYYRFQYDLDGTNLRTIETSTVMLINQWVHLAVVRNGNNFRIYVNGIVRADEDYADTLLASPDTMGPHLSSYTDQLRVSKGIARWTAPFTPPTEPYE